MNQESKEFKISQYNFTEGQINKLISMQDELNSYIHPEWRTQVFDWNLAIIDECIEIHGHLGWKWWKKDYKLGLTAANEMQVQLEVIDILHFVLSQSIELGFDLTEINCKTANSSYTLVEAVNYIMQDVISLGYTAIGQWAVLAHAAGLTEQEILETYMQKYVLNKFRQDHGYKDGSYVKVWTSPDDGFGYEDNECLSEIVGDMTVCGDDTTDEIELYKRLQAMYTSRLNQ